MEDVTGTVMLVAWCVLMYSLLRRIQKRARALEELAQASETEAATVLQQVQHTGRSTRRWGRREAHADPNEEAKLSGSWG